jgi:hypothetical protein
LADDFGELILVLAEVGLEIDFDAASLNTCGGLEACRNENRGPSSFSPSSDAFRPANAQSSHSVRI